MQEMQETGVQTLGREDPLEEEMYVFLLGKFHGQSSLVGHSPWGRKGSDMTEQLSVCVRARARTHMHTLTQAKKAEEY